MHGAHKVEAAEAVSDLGQTYVFFFLFSTNLPDSIRQVS